jgi:hypothetical protein
MPYNLIFILHLHYNYIAWCYIGYMWFVLCNVNIQWCGGLHDTTSRSAAVYLLYAKHCASHITTEGTNVQLIRTGNIKFDMYSVYEYIYKLFTKNGISAMTKVSMKGNFGVAGYQQIWHRENKRHHTNDKFFKEYSNRWILIRALPYYYLSTTGRNKTSHYNVRGLEL